MCFVMSEGLECWPYKLPVNIITDGVRYPGLFPIKRHEIFLEIYSGQSLREGRQF